MIKGKLSARAVALQDLVSDMKVLDKKEISLGLMHLEINEQTKRTLEEEIEQKHKAEIEKVEFMRSGFSAFLRCFVGADYSSISFTLR